MHEIFLELSCMKCVLENPQKGNAQLIRQNDILFTQMKLVYCLTKKHFALGPQGHKHHIFGDHFFVRKLKFHVFFLFHVRKHMISSFNLKWTELTRYCEFCSNCESLGTRTKLVKIHNLLWIRSALGKMMV